MLVFRPFEKNLFGQTRSWSAESGGGQYVIAKAATADTYQASYQTTGAKPLLLHNGAWLPAFERAKQICEQDSSARMRQRIAEKARARPGR